MELPRDTTTTGKRTKLKLKIETISNWIQNILKIISFQEYANI